MASVDEKKSGVDKMREAFTKKERVKTPTLLQMEAVECGAASLGIILAHFGRVETLEVLRDECGVSRDGSRAGDVMRAGKRYGLDVKGYRKEPHQLIDMPKPMIVFWKFYHFLVVEGFSEKYVYLNDPASGPRKVTYEEFNESFTGIVLTFKPTDDFEKGGEPNNLLSSLFRRLKGAEQALSYLFIISLMLVIPGLIIPTFSKLFVDNILIREMESWFMPLIIGMLVTAFLRGGLSWLQQHYLLKLEVRLALNTSVQFFWHVLKLPVGFFSQRSAGDISNRVMINNKVAKLLSGQLATNTLNLLMIVFYAAVMIQYDVILTLVGIAFAFMNMGILKYVSRYRKDSNMLVQQEQGKLMGAAMNGIRSMESIKASGLEDDLFQKLMGFQTKVVNARQRLSKMSQLLASVPGLLSTLNTALILSIGGIRVMDGAISIGMLVAFQSLMESFSKPVNELVGLGTQIQDAEADMNRLDDVLNYEEDEKFTREKKLIGKGESSSVDLKLEGYLEIKNLTFGYNKLADPLIENFNLNLEPGKRVALIGASGSGKSTIAKIVCGLEQPWDGEILFDSVPKTDIHPDKIQNSVGYVDQNVFLFQGTVRDNISLWDPTMPDQIIREALRDAAILDEISARKDGLSAMIDEGGQNFSGGQKQRIEIARALASEPSILVLDEPTSALDAETERKIDQAIRRRGMTCLIIAHRLSTIRDSDEIIVMDKGKIVQRGTHEAMKEEDGLYKNLIKSR